MSAYGAKAKDFNQGMRRAIPGWTPQIISTYNNHANKPIPSMEQYFITGITDVELRKVSNQQIQTGYMMLMIDDSLEWLHAPRDMNLTEEYQKVRTICSRY